MQIATINVGSSSIKFGLFSSGNQPQQLAEATITNIGQSSPQMVVTDKPATPVEAPDHQTATTLLADWLKQQPGGVQAVGHRIVHGGPKYSQAVLINDQTVTDLKDLILFAPEHLPAEIQVIESFKTLFPGIKQVACFDTAFHHDLPAQARLLPIPRRYEAQGLRRYGFHGLSYTYLMQELTHLDANEANGKVILAHLGSGVSLAAVNQGKPVDTTMGLTPASGLPMSTRSGDLDPGLSVYLAKKDGLTPEQLSHLVNFESGLLGVSGTSADMEQLLNSQATDPQAKEAVDLFCYQVKKAIGGLAAVMGGVDTLVFSGGMGEQAPQIRERICAGLDFLAIKNVRVIHTDEAVVIAQEVQKLVGNDDTQA
jgi:acetate kinase